MPIQHCPDRRAPHHPSGGHQNSIGGDIEKVFGWIYWIKQWVGRPHRRAATPAPWARYISQYVPTHLFMSDPSLPLSRQFTVAMHSRAIDACDNIEELRSIAKSLLSVWQTQAMFSEQYGAELLGIKPRA